MHADLIGENNWLNFAKTSENYRYQSDANWCMTRQLRQQLDANRAGELKQKTGARTRDGNTVLQSSVQRGWTAKNKNFGWRNGLFF